MKTFWFTLCVIIVHDFSLLVSTGDEGHVDFEFVS